MNGNNTRAWKASTGYDQAAAWESQDPVFAAILDNPNCSCLSQFLMRPNQTVRNETLCVLANGSRGGRGGFLESVAPNQRFPLAGAWERTPIHHLKRHFGFVGNKDASVPAAEVTAIRTRQGKRKTDLVQGGGFLSRLLDLRKGLRSRRGRWHVPPGHTFKLVTERLVPIGQPYVLCRQLRLHFIDYPDPIAIDSSLVGNEAAAAHGGDPRFVDGPRRSPTQVQQAIAAGVENGLRCASRMRNFTAGCAAQPGARTRLCMKSAEHVRLPFNVARMSAGH